MRFILIRHGETYANALYNTNKRILIGTLDQPVSQLNDVGIQQAKETKVLLENYIIDEMYSSDLGRTKKNALIVFPNIYGTIYYGVVNAIASAFYSTPLSLISMNALNDYDKQENIVGRVIARETYLSISRCIGMLIVLCHSLLPENLYLYVSVITLSLSPIVLVIYSNLYHKKKDAMKSLNQL